jgi:SseB protein N-terminal domain
MSVLDGLHAAMQAGGEAEGRAFFRALADAELFLLLEDEAQGEVLRPRVFDLQDGPVLLAFDSEERLAEFAGAPLPYAALPGRVIAAQMAGQGRGLALGLNLGSGAPSETILPPEALDWLIAMLDQAPPETRQARARSFQTPAVPQAVLAALVPALAGALGAEGRALLAGVRYDDGQAGHVLAMTGTAPGDAEGLARAVTEALAFSGLEATALDLVFLAPDDPVLARMASVALTLEGATAPTPPAPAPPAGPGMDPTRPPILR